VKPTLLGNSQLQLRKMDVSVGHKELKGDRQPVKEVIGPESNNIPAKITSVYETIREQTLNEAKWSDVVVGKYKKFAYRRWENTYPIPVITTCYELPCISEECEMLVCNSTGNQDVGKHRKKKI
jgi:hypothetical protein